MARPYSNDLRARVIEDIEAGASRREAAERYELSPSVVVIWAQRWKETGSVAAKPSGGSTSPLEEHAEFCGKSVVTGRSAGPVGSGRARMVRARLGVVAIPSAAMLA